MDSGCAVGTPMQSARAPRRGAAIWVRSTAAASVSARRSSTMDVQDVPRDLAATRQAFANLQTTQNDRLGSIIEIQRAVGATDLDVDAVMRVICTRTQVLTHAESAAILILDGDGFELRVATGF